LFCLLSFLAISFAILSSTWTGDHPCKNRNEPNLATKSVSVAKPNLCWPCLLCLDSLECVPIFYVKGFWPLVNIIGLFYMRFF
jgi:hypothetical protein